MKLFSCHHGDGRQELSRCKKVMEERGQLFVDKISMSRGKVAKLCHTFIKDGAVSLTPKEKKKAS